MKTSVCRRRLALFAGYKNVGSRPSSVQSALPRRSVLNREGRRCVIDRLPKKLPISFCRNGYSHAAGAQLFSSR